MAREWSRRSIEEIARNIAKGLSSGFYKSGDLNTGTFWPHSRSGMYANSIELDDTKVGDSPNVKLYLPALGSMDGVVDAYSNNVYLLGPCPFFGRLDLSSPSHLEDAWQYGLVRSTEPWDVNKKTFPLFDRSNNQFDVILQTCCEEYYGAPEYNLSQDYTTSDIKFLIELLYVTEANSKKYYPNGGGFNIPCIFIVGSQVPTIYSAISTWHSSHSNTGVPALIMRAK